MKFVSLDESCSFRTKISGSDSQIYPGTFLILVTVRELPFNVYRGKSIANLEARNEAMNQKDPENKKVKSNRDTTWQLHFLWAMRSSTKILSTRASMATKRTSVFDGRLHFTISATWLDDVTYAIPFSLLVWQVRHFCLDSLVTLCLIHFAQGPRGSRPDRFQFHLQQRRAKWRSDVFDTILVFAHHTDSRCQYRSWQKKVIHLFVGSWLCVSSFPRSRTSYTYRKLHIHSVWSSRKSLHIMNSIECVAYPGDDGKPCLHKSPSESSEKYPSSHEVRRWHLLESYSYVNMLWSV